MRRALTAAFVLLAGSALLGATVFQEQVVTAAQNVPAFFINNDTSHPVPVAEQNLDGANGDSIRVHEQGTADVNITNSTVPVEGTVQVAESRVPFQRTYSWDNWESEKFRSFDIDIDDGKIFVVQSVSVTAVVPTGQKARADFTAQAGGPSTFEIPLARVDGFGGGGDLFAGTESLTAYAKGTFGILASVERNSTSGVGGRVALAVSGYLIDE